MNLNFSKISEILDVASKDNRINILEHEGYEILRCLDIMVPEFEFIPISNFKTHKVNNKFIKKNEKVVIKIVSPEILHKSDVGGVVVVDASERSILEALETMNTRFKNKNPKGFLLCEFIHHDNSLGSELLIGIRMTSDFGPILTFGPGGIYTEFLSKNLCQDKSVIIISPEVYNKKNIESSLEKLAITSLATKDFRGKKASIDLKTIIELIEKFLLFAKEFIPSRISEFEVNPFVISFGKILALDVLANINTQIYEQNNSRPVEKIKNILEPRSAAIIGVSEKINVGRIILNNFIKEGFSKEKLFVIKPGIDLIDGCKCFPTIESLPERVDLFVVCTPAATIPDVITELIKYEKAEGIIVIPGGLEEKSGSEQIILQMKTTLTDSRNTKWKGPVINGGNCLGIISRPGKYDNMFIPEYKKTKTPEKISKLAFISQSGAFAVSRLNKLAGINPKFSITIGNQMDLTLGDYLSYLKNDPDIEIFSIYLEGFKSLDGKKFLKAAKEIIDKGKHIIFYSSGKTKEGAKAMASHTASIAGDYSVTRELCRQIGIVHAENFSDFEDLTKLFVFLGDRLVSGKKLGVVSNAGCECVAASDNLRNFTLSSFSDSTRSGLIKVFKENRIDSIVDLHNPIDLTPMAGDGAYKETAGLVLNDINVDVAIIACIPLAPALNALEKGSGHNEDLLNEKSVVQRLINLHKNTKKAWVAVIDAGSLFDPMARIFETNGIPTFRTIDNALRLFDRYCTSRLRKI